MRKKTSQLALIGVSVEVVSSRNPSLVGIAGEVIDETRNTLRLLTPKGVKVLVKDAVTLNIDGQVIDGDKFIGRIEERIKRSR